MVCDEEDEGLDFDTLNKINKDSEITQSSFDAYDVNRYPKKEIELATYQDQVDHLKSHFSGSAQKTKRIVTEASH